MGSAGSVLKVKGGVGASALLSDQRTGRRRIAFQSVSQSEETPGDWGVTDSPEAVALQSETRDCLQH